MDPTIPGARPNTFAAAGDTGAGKARPPSGGGRWFARYMLIVAIGGNGVFYAQAWEIFCTSSARDVSLPGFAVALWAALSWLAYGIHLRNSVIIICNILAVLGASAVVGGTLLYA